MKQFDEFLVEYVLNHANQFRGKNTSEVLDFARKAWRRYIDKLTIGDEISKRHLGRVKETKADGVKDIARWLKIRPTTELYQSLYAGKIAFFKKGQ